MGLFKLMTVTALEQVKAAMNVSKTTMGLTGAWHLSSILPAWPCSLGSGCRRVDSLDNMTVDKYARPYILDPKPI